MRYSILILLGLFLSCSNSPKELMSDFSADFPKAEQLTKITQYNNLEIYNPRSFVVKDSILFIMERGFDYFGRCFNINTGKEITKFAFKGKSKTEMIAAHKIALYGQDSINVINWNTPTSIKTFSIYDILNNINSTPSEVVMADSVRSNNFIKINGNELFGSGGICKAGDITREILGRYFIIKENTTTTFGSFNPELFESNIEIGTNEMNTMNDQLYVVNPVTKKIFAATENGVLFEIIDLKKQDIESSRYYEKNKIEILKEGYSTSYRNCSSSSIMGVAGNDKNIYALKATLITEAPKSYNGNLLVFDWDLNPIKMYEVSIKGEDLQYISENGDYLFTLKLDSNDTYSLIKYKI